MFRKSAILVLVLLAGASLKAQYQPGYIIPEGQDTMKGWVRWVRPIIYFKADKRKKSKKFEAEELTGFGYKERSFEYHCVETFAENFPEMKCGFLELLENGPVLLYRYDTYDIYGNATLPNFYVKKNVDGGLFIRVRRGKMGFKREMAQFFEDNDEVKSGIKSKKYNYETLRQMVADYNELAYLNPPDWQKANEEKAVEEEEMKEESDE